MFLEGCLGGFIIRVVCVCSFGGGCGILFVLGGV